MTEHVRSNYRNHRKATWGFAIALMVAIAAVVIPIASGASDKTYTMLFPRGRRHAGAAGEREHDEPDAVFELGLHREGGDHEHRQVSPARVRGRYVPRQRDALGRHVPGRFASGLADLQERTTSSRFGSSRFRRATRSRLSLLSTPLDRCQQPQSIIAQGQAVKRLQRHGGRRERVRQPDLPDDQRPGLRRNHYGPRVPRPRPERLVRDRRPQQSVADERHRQAGVEGHSAAKDGSTTYANVDSGHCRTRTACTRSRPDRQRLPAVRHCPNAADSSTSWGVRAVAGVTLADGCAPSPTSDAAKGLSVYTSAQRGDDRAGLRSRSDHDAELRRRRHGDRRELHRHGRRQHDARTRSTTCRRRGPTTATRTSCSRRSTPARVAPARSTCSSRCPARSCRAISGRPTRSSSSTTTPSPSGRSRRCRTASRILA